MTKKERKWEDIIDYDIRDGKTMKNLETSYFISVI
jgi:hypothetical protein